MNISRRFFIAGAASFGAFGGSRLLRAAPGAASGKPNLTFGVVSDIHAILADDGAEDIVG
jgi:hypothetical protein